MDYEELNTKLKNIDNNFNVEVQEATEDYYLITFEELDVAMVRESHFMVSDSKIIAQHPGVLILISQFANTPEKLKAVQHKQQDSKSRKSETKVDPSTLDPDELISTDEAAKEFSNISRAMLYNAVSRNSIPHYKFGNALRFKRSAVSDYSHKIGKRITGNSHGQTKKIILDKDGNKMLTTKDISKVINLTPATVSVLITKGDLKGIKYGHTYYVSKSDFNSYIESSKQ